MRLTDKLPVLGLGDRLGLAPESVLVRWFTGKSSHIHLHLLT